MRNDLSFSATYGDALRAGVGLLREANATQTPDLDAQVLLTHVTGATRAVLLAFPERPLTHEQASAYAALVRRRADREPVAYLTGHREFMGLDFLTDARVLIPRPETEHLVEAALAEIRARLDHEETPVIADIGTGSGAIALSLVALEPRLSRVYATDVSSAALALAAENASHLGVASRVTFLQGDLLDPLTEPLDVLLANLPYVAPRDASILAPDVSRFEPSLALYGAEDGLGHLRRLFAQAADHLRPSATLLLEFGYDQRTAVEALVRATFPRSTIHIGADYAGWDRYAVIHLDTAIRVSETPTPPSGQPPD
ncbi:MAG TPA: peptide chain release factor N(5)-glutamine methyltransferase [Ktedonobacterales bacterium]|nr:peptide chain release factor N(5)-glutamine methyltransferase [Ktedonobacterales bacterium]